MTICGTLHYKYKRLNGASVEADFWHGEHIDNAEKKLLIASFTEAPFMVKLDF